MPDWDTEIMIFVALIGTCWAVLSVPAALVLARMLRNGHALDPRFITDPQAARGALVPPNR